MSALVHSANVKYAVMQVPSKADSRGRVVLAFSDEQSLRNLVAGHTIIAHRIASREEAAEVVAGNSQRASLPGAAEQEEWVNENGKCNLTFRWWQGQLAASFGGWKHRNIAYNTVRFALASAVLFLYSKNIVSSIIRTVLGI